MHCNDLKQLFTYILLFSGLSLWAQHVHEHDVEASPKFQENKGQWPKQVTYKVEVPNGNIFLEDHGLTYVFTSEADMSMVHEAHHGSVTLPANFAVHHHAYKVNFKGSLEPETVTGDGMYTDYVNYFVGKDPSKWAGGVQQFRKVKYAGIYPNVDFHMYAQHGNLKYDFVIGPGGDPDNIVMQFDGADNLKIRKGFLRIETSVTEIVEQKPVAYQMINGQKIDVPCKFRLRGKELSFVFPQGYDHTQTLIIDPVLVFSSYTGALSDNWGYTATYDDKGNVYAGGASFGANYPTTTGAFQTSFAGGTGNFHTDIGITVFDATGANLLYSTYLGGSGNDNPHSLVVNNAGELYVLGTTSSSDYPVTPTAYDTSFGGGPKVRGEDLDYVNGADIIVTKFNGTGTGLIGSTFVGGTGTDGLNNTTGPDYNYGDAYRGEIIVDAADNCYIASSTASTDFPTTAGAPQSTLGGGQDACVFKLNSNLSTMIWSTYLGGSNNDGGYGVQIDRSGNVFVAGGAGSPDFPTTSGAYKSTHGGLMDGFVAKLNATGTNILACTFNGTPKYDQNFFVQLDLNDDVFVVGQTEGNYPITPPTVYNNGGSGQFINKFNNNLSSSLVSTRIGSGRGTVDISISAFLVDQCDHIYVAGWGGVINRQYSQAKQSSTTGLPVTTGAYKGSTNGSDFYLMVLKKDCDSLLYATFFGGGNLDHVDGGTSRFDKKGIVYQAVCAGCGGNSSFPSTPGAYSTTNKSRNCNLAAMKFDLSNLTADVGFVAKPYYCAPTTITFTNTSNGGTNYYWNFGDGQTSMAFSPTHTYNKAGLYNVSLIVTDSLSCTLSDTAELTVRVIAPPVASVNPSNAMCPGDSMQLSASGGATYQWIPAKGLSNPNIANPKASPDSTTTYQVLVSDTCGTDTASVTVTIFLDPTTLINDTSLCRGNNILLQASGAVTYNWSPGTYLSSNNINNPICTPYNTITYNVTMVDKNQCTWVKPITVKVDTVLPVPIASPDTTICSGDTIRLDVSDGDYFSWTPKRFIDSINIRNPKVFPSGPINYIVVAANGCGTGTDTATVMVSLVPVQTPGTLKVCIGDPAQLSASSPGGVSYHWTPSSGLNDPNIPNPVAAITGPIQYYVDVIDTLGCKGGGKIFVDTLPRPYVFAGVDVTVGFMQDQELLLRTNADSVIWSPGTYLSCIYCKGPTVQKPEESITYIVEAIDQNGCNDFDTITVFIEGSFYAPNTFTPNGDGVNDVFHVYGKEISELELYIFDRWGELLFTSNDMEIGWDGTVNGNMAKTDTYVWKATYVETSGKEHTVTGHVNLLK